MRIGVYGGSFDPIHYGHLILAEQCREQAGLDEVWFVPAARHPLKTDHAPAAFERRVDMLNLALAGQVGYRIDELENERPGLSYTADTLDQIRARHPSAELVLLLGSDCLPDLPMWREPQRIVAGAGLVVMERPGWPVVSAAELQAALGLATPPRMARVDVPLIDLASRDIRRRVAGGKSVRFMLPRAVEEYIRDKKLYRSAE